MEIDSELSCNSVIWISSLPADEHGPSRRMVEEMRSLSQQLGFGFQRIEVTSAQQLTGLLEELTVHASEQRMRPLLNFDMHGSKDKGLLISGANEYLSWRCLAECLRKLNTCTGNNLCVVGAACYGLRAIMPVKLDQPTPFFILLAPEEEVSVGFLEKNLPAFYRDLFQSGSIDGSYRRELSDKFKYFHCERMLFIVVARYIREACKGRSAEQRRERLLSDVFLNGIEKTPQKLREVRKKIKEGIRPNQALLDRYAKIFLIDKPCNFNIDQLLAFVNGPGAAEWPDDEGQG